MANVKNYGLIGVGQNLQFAKGGVNLLTTPGIFSFKSANGTSDAALTTAGITSSAGNVTLTTGNVVLTSTSGNVSIGGDTTIQRAQAGVIQFAGTGSIVVPSGTSAQEPNLGSTAGGFRFNTTSGYMEYYNGSIWQSMATGGGSVSNLAGGTAGQVPYQSGPSTTTFTGPGTTGQVLTSNGTSGPTFTNVVNSLAGTANQVSVSASTGNVTLTLPNSVILPGTLQVTGVSAFYTNHIATAAGTTQGTAAPITATYTIVDDTPTGTGVRLPIATSVGQLHYITNDGTYNLLVYPNSGATLDGAGANLPAMLPAGESVGYVYDSSDHWTSVSDANFAGPGISITHASAGGTTISNTGVLSFTAGTTGFTPSSATNGDITLDGILVPSHGGTGINNGSNTITLGGNINTGGAFTTTPGNAVTFTTTGSTNVTLPTSGTLATTGGTVANATGTTNRITVNGDYSSHTGAITVDIASTYVGQASITTLGTVTTGTWNASTVDVPHGGTGATTFTSKGVVYGNGTGSLLATAAGTQYQVLNAGAGGTPVFDAVHLDEPSAVTGTLALVNGGTNNALTGSNGSIIYNDGSKLVNSTVGSNNQALISSGSGAPTWLTVSSTLTTNQIVQGNGSGTFTANGATFIGSGTTSGVTLNGTVTQATDATTKAYVDSVASGIDIKQATRVATTTALTATYVNNGGATGAGSTLTNSGTQAALVIDGITLLVNDRILIKNQAAPIGNGIYTVTNVGSGSTNWVLTRASDYVNTIPDTVHDGVFNFVQEGTVNANSGWVQNTFGTGGTVGSGDIAFGTDPLVYTQFSGAGTYLPGAALSLTGNTFDVRVDNSTIRVDGGNNLAVLSDSVIDHVLLSQGAGNTATWGALPINNNDAVTGVLRAVNGGTGHGSYTAGDMLYADTTTTLTTLPIGSANQALVIVGGVPTWQNVVNSFTTSLSGLTPSTSSTGAITLAGTLGVPSGGTGATTLTANGVVYGNGTGAVGVTAAGTTGQVLVGNTAGAPSWATVSSTLVSSFSGGTTGLTPNTPTTGAIVLGGTLNVANGGTGATTFNSNSLLVGHGTGAVTAPSNLSFTGSTLTVGTATLFGDTVDTTLTATGTNGNINLNPNGTGAVVIGPASTDGIIQSDPGKALTVKGNTTLTLQGGTTGASVVLSMVNGAFAAIGGYWAGQAEAYASLIKTQPEAIPNVQYVTDAITAATDAEGAIQSVSAVVPLNVNGTVNLSNALDVTATILSVKVKVTTADAGATLSVGHAGGISDFMTTAENDPQTVGIYMAELYNTASGGTQVTATVASSAGTSGSSCLVIVTYAT